MTPPGAEQPDTVKVSRGLAERLCHRDNYTRQMARRELRNMLLGKEGEACATTDGATATP